MCTASGFSYCTRLRLNNPFSQRSENGRDIRVDSETQSSYPVPALSIPVHKQDPGFPFPSIQKSLFLLQSARRLSWQK
jgi:hypothetical protein